MILLSPVLGNRSFDRVTMGGLSISWRSACSRCRDGRYLDRRDIGGLLCSVDLLLNHQWDSLRHCLLHLCNALFPLRVHFHEHLPCSTFLLSSIVVDSLLQLLCKVPILW